MNARDDVLARIRSALGDHGRDHVDVPRDYDRQGTRAPGDAALIDLLEDRLIDYRAHVRRASDEERSAAIAEAVMHGLRLAPAPSSDDRRPRFVVPSGLPTHWLSASSVEPIADDGLSAAELDGCDGVITAAAVAIAETGTIVLDGSADQGRRAITLVPDLHVCVVRADQIVETVPEGVALLDPRRPQTWISGPSATSDIELDRVEGVHGPRVLEVVLLHA